MNGAELAARYAFPPNSLGYCGRKEFCSALRSGRAAGLKSGLRKFRAHYAYLSLIARANGMGPFDRNVVEAFWIGNRLLASVSPAALRRLIARLIKDKVRARRLIARLPRGVLPHHSFNSLYVNFVTDSVRRSVKNYDSCCVTAGRVLSVGPRRAKVRRFAIAREGGRFHLGQKTCSVLLEKGGIRLAGRLRPGDLVSVHWGMAVQKLRPRDCEALKKYTMINLGACNDAAQGD